MKIFRKPMKQDKNQKSLKTWSKKQKKDLNKCARLKTYLFFPCPLLKASLTICHPEVQT